jgi:hypothetical protein
MIVVSHFPLLFLALPGRFCPPNWNPPFLSACACKGALAGVRAGAHTACKLCTNRQTHWRARTRSTVALKMARFGPFFWYVCGHGRPRGPLTGGCGRHGPGHTSVEFDTPGAKAPNLVLNHRANPMQAPLANCGNPGDAACFLHTKPPSFLLPDGAMGGRPQVIVWKM